MNLDDTRLSEVSQTQKDKHCVIPQIRSPRGVRFIKTETRTVVGRSWGRGKWGALWAELRPFPKITR